MITPTEKAALAEKGISYLGALETGQRYYVFVSLMQVQVYVQHTGV